MVVGVPLLPACLRKADGDVPVFRSGPVPIHHSCSLAIWCATELPFPPSPMSSSYLFIIKASVPHAKEDSGSLPEASCLVLGPILVREVMTITVTVALEKKFHDTV